MRSKKGDKFSTPHARTRLANRYKLALPWNKWEEICDHAFSGRFEIMTSTVTRKEILVPSETNTHHGQIPMVWETPNKDYPKGRIVTVLPLEKGYWKENKEEQKEKS